MCGLIARFASPDAATLPLPRMMNLMGHRGPDASGAVGWNGREAPSVIPAGRSAECRHVLAHLRLSIIDRDPQSDQPFRSEDGRFYLAYNGEIYNYLELKKVLTQSGSRFRTEGDTEVLLEAWRKWGPECLGRLEGMFAFVIYDHESGRAFAARDAFGIKPLFLSQCSGEIRIASELPAILEDSGPRTLDPLSAARGLRWGMNDGYRATIFSGVERVPPGTWIEIDPETVRVSQPRIFFDLEAIEQREWDFGEARQALRDAFVGSVERHLRSDAPLGFALSGGIDSSAIVCAAHALGRTSFETFSYVPGDERISERKWIDLVAKHVGATTHFISPHADQLAAHLPDVVRHQAEPFASLSIYAQYEVYAEAKRRGIKVILSGQGADELLAGYVSYYQAAIADSLRRGRLLSALRQLRVLHDRFGQSYASAAGWLARLWLPGPLRDRAAKAYLRSHAPWLNLAAMERVGMRDWTALEEGRWRPRGVRQMLVSSMRQSLVALLRYDDRNSMAHSVESRVPFLTPELARLCLSFPDHFFINDRGVTKYIFREAMRGIVPDPILDRPDKIGFAPDDRAWNSAIAPLSSDSSSHLVGGLVNTSELKAAQKGFGQRTQTDSWLLWRALNLAQLEQMYDLAPS